MYSNPQIAIKSFVRLMKEVSPELTLETNHLPTSRHALTSQKNLSPRTTFPDWHPAAIMSRKISYSLFLVFIVSDFGTVSS